MRPIVQFSSDNAVLNEALNEHLSTLVLTDNSGITADTLTITIDDPDSSIAFPRKGIRLGVAIGYAESKLIDKGIFTVDEASIEGWPRKIVISARGPELRKSDAKAPKNRSFSDVSLGDVVKRIAADNGLTPRVSPQFSDDVLEHVDQSSESDLHFLTKLAGERGAIYKIIGKNLVFVVRGQAKNAAGIPLTPSSIAANGISSFEYMEPDRDKYGAVKANYYNVQTAEHLAVVVGKGSPVLELKKSFPNQKEASIAANTKYSAQKRGQSTFTFECEGVPEMQADGPLSVSGLGAPIDGDDWVIESVVHNLGSAYVCSGTAKRGETAQDDDEEESQPESEPDSGDDSEDVDTEFDEDE